MPQSQMQTQTGEQKHRNEAGVRQRGGRVAAVERWKRTPPFKPAATCYYLTPAECYHVQTQTRSCQNRFFKRSQKSGFLCNIPRALTITDWSTKVKLLQPSNSIPGFIPIGDRHLLRPRDTFIIVKLWAPACAIDWQKGNNCLFTQWNTMQ